MHSRVAIGCCLLLLLTTGACGPSDPLGRKAISGSVTINETPVESGNISFEPDGGGAVTSSGANITSGKYSIERQFGLPVGKYRVRIYIPKPGTGGKVDEEALPGEAVAPPEDMAPPDWNYNSKRTIDVTEDGPHVYDFDIKTKKKK